MFQRSTAKNTIRFSFSHSLTSLFCCFFPSPQPTWFSLCHTRSPSLLISLASSLLFDPVHHLPSISHCPLWVSTSLSYCLVFRLTLLLKKTTQKLFILRDESEASARSQPYHHQALKPTVPTKHMDNVQRNSSIQYIYVDVCMHDITSFNEPLSLSRDCSGFQPGFCSTTLSECFSTRQTRTASSNREPSDVSAHRPVKCKPSSGLWTGVSGIKDGHAVIH